MFSVVIPLYNKEKYVARSIQSVLDQSFPEFELIIVNDGSTDGGPEVVASFEDQRLKTIDQPNAGVSAARNRGVQHARYDHVAFLDADDWWAPEFLAEMCTLVKSFPAAGLYGSSYYVRKNRTDTRANIGLPDEFTRGYIDYFAVYARTFWVPVNCSFVVVQKALFREAGGFCPALKFGEDFDLWVRLALKAQVAYVNKPLAYSNQDVEAAGRALGTGKSWKRSEHVIFNLEYLAKEETTNPTLKTLLDGLRVRSLAPFYLEARYPADIRAILDTVDFTKQPLSYRRFYHWPRGVISMYFQGRQVASYVKQSLIRNYQRLLSH
jgi:glycosyltransferase involved in cell wall biosynthesis